MTDEQQPERPKSVADMPLGAVPQPSPLRVVFDVNAMKIGDPATGQAQPAVRLDIYTAHGIDCVFISANQAVELATILIDEAKKARKIPDPLLIASELPKANGHGPLG